MKVVLVVVVLIAVLLTVVYYTGGFSTFDATEEGRKARAAIAAGMTFDQACDLTGDPKRYRKIKLVRNERTGEEDEQLLPEVATTRERLAATIDEGTLPHGFQCTFRYSGSVAFTVRYDSLGDVVGVWDVTTMADLLGP
jgi:hypothetical protein